MARWLSLNAPLSWKVALSVAQCLNLTSFWNLLNSAVQLEKERKRWRGHNKVIERLEEKGLSSIVVLISDGAGRKAGVHFTPACYPKIRSHWSPGNILSVLPFDYYCLLPHYFSQLHNLIENWGCVPDCKIVIMQLQFLEEKHCSARKQNSSSSAIRQSLPEDQEFKTLSSALEEVHHKGTLMERVAMLENRVLQACF